MYPTCAKDCMTLLKGTRKLINKVVEKNMADSILFSAGTDTSIIAYEAVKTNPKIPALTIAFKQGVPKDTEYVKAMVEYLKLNQKTFIFEKAEALETLPKVVAALKTFDPMEIRNSIPVYIGLNLLKKTGNKSAFTGDGLDELFGYPWQFQLSDEEMIKNQLSMWATMSFSSIPMAKSLGIEVKQPYLDQEFMAWAKSLPLKIKINMHNEVKYGKWILRKAYEDFLPLEVVWRPKAPAEQGTGADACPKVIAEEYSDIDFANKKANIQNQDSVVIRDKEHLLYYETFKKIFGKPLNLFSKSENTKLCPQCQSPVKKQVHFCKVCGAYPI